MAKGAIILICTYIIDPTFSGMATDHVIRPPNPVRNPLVTPWAFFNRIKLSITWSPEVYFLK